MERLARWVELLHGRALGLAQLLLQMEHSQLLATNLGRLLVFGQLLALFIGLIQLLQCLQPFCGLRMTYSTVRQSSSAQLLIRISICCCLALGVTLLSLILDQTELSSSHLILHKHLLGIFFILSIEYIKSAIEERYPFLVFDA